MAKYKVKDGHKFGLLPAGTVVEMSEADAVVHSRHLERVADAPSVDTPPGDLQNVSGITVAPEHKLLTEEGKPNYASLTVLQLREELRTRGLDTTGTKSELVARLERSDERDAG